MRMTRTCQAGPDAILFDLDNTLCTFIDAKKAACRAAIETIGSGDAEELFEYFRRPVHHFEDTAHIGDYLKDTRVYTREIEEEAAEVFESVKLERISLYPGVTGILTALISEGIRVAIVTDAHSSHALRRMEKTGLDRVIRTLVTPDRSGKRKPDHTPFLMAMQELDADPERTWVVGDSLLREIVPGLELGLTTIFCRYGDWYHLDRPDITPHFTLDRFSDLMDLPGLK